MSKEENLLKQLILEEVHAEIKATFKSVRTKLAPFTVNIDETEVSSFLKVGDGDKVLTADCLSEGKEAVELLPPYFKMADIQTSDMLYDQLYELEDAAFDVYLHIRRNRMLAGSEAMSGVSTFYAYIKTAATGKIKRATAVSMYKRLQGYYLKRLEASKAKKRKAEADKAAAEVVRVAVEAERAAEKAAAAA